MRLRKTNILYLDAFGDIHGGGQVSLLNLLKKLNREVFLPLVVCPYEGNFTAMLRGMNIGVEIINFPSIRRLNFIAIISAFFRLSRLLKEKEIDIIHANAPRPAFYGGIVSLTSGIPLIWHVRISHRDLLLDGILSRLSTKIIVVSETVKKKFKKYPQGVQDKIFTIYNGVDLMEFNPSRNGDRLREKLGLGNEPVVGIVGRLNPDKGHKYFIEAASQIPLKCKFLIVGDGPLRKELEAEVKRTDISERVIFTGFRSDISEIMAAIDVFVLTSEKEHFGRVLIEAMASAKPVVAFDAGAVGEIVVDGENGFLVPPKNTQILAQRITYLLNDKAMTMKMGCAGCVRTEKFFDLKMQTRKIEEVYQELLQG